MACVNDVESAHSRATSPPHGTVNASVIAAHGLDRRAGVTVDEKSEAADDDEEGDKDAFNRLAGAIFASFSLSILDFSSFASLTRLYDRRQPKMPLVV